jgi:hypothetical protein
MSHFVKWELAPVAVCTSKYAPKTDMGIVAGTHIKSENESFCVKHRKEQHHHTLSKTESRNVL